MEKKGIVVIKASERMSDDSLLNVIGGKSPVRRDFCGTFCNPVYCGAFSRPDTTKVDRPIILQIQKKKRR